MEIARFTLDGCFGCAAAPKDPLIATLGAHVCAADRLHGDDTLAPVLDPGDCKTKTGRLWAYVCDGPPWG